MPRNAAQSAHNTKTCVSLSHAAYAALEGLQERSGLSRSALLSALVLKEFYSGDSIVPLVVENEFHRSDAGVRCANIFAFASFIVDNPQHSGRELMAAKTAMAICEIQWLTCGNGVKALPDEQAAIDSVLATHHGSYTCGTRMSPHVVNGYKHTLLARRDNLMLSDHAIAYLRQRATYFRLRGATVKETPHVNALVKRRMEQDIMGPDLQDSLSATDKE